jgi:predicted enzyme related to lactoylglutathione lyase
MTGMPIWYELMTPDPAGVAAFYRAVGGWDIPAQGNAMPNGS